MFKYEALFLLVARTEVLPGILSQKLERLEKDYLEMKKKIQEGIPLDDLEPLSVDTLGITEETCYSPALVWTVTHLKNMSCV